MVIFLALVSAGIGLAVMMAALAYELLAAHRRRRLLRRVDHFVSGGSESYIGGPPGSDQRPGDVEASSGKVHDSWRSRWADRALGVLDRFKLLARMSVQKASADGGAEGAGKVGERASPQHASKSASFEQAELFLLRAGYHHPDAVQRFFVLKSALFLLLPIFGVGMLALAADLGSAQQWVTVVTLCAAAAYYGPDWVLKHRAQARRLAMQQQLPGFADLLLICVESGMGLDAAVQRVVRDYRGSAPELSEAFHRASLEMRAGVSRHHALSKLSLACDLSDISNMVRMLLQSEQFGTSLGDALRIQSEEIRSKRMMLAEESAAKVPLKMLFPLALCVFPSMMIVLIGPAILGIMSTSF